MFIALASTRTLFFIAVVYVLWLLWQPKVSVLIMGKMKIGFNCCLISGILTELFSSPEPSGSQGELIVYPYSGVRCHRHRRQQCLNIFSSETALPIKARFYVEPPWEGGTKVYINGPGHMTKVAAMPIYGKNL